MNEAESPHLKRGLKNRHIQLIALGGAVGTGLFLGLGKSVQIAGPSVIFGYAIAGFVAFLIMRQLGEMIVEEPVAGSFSHFAYKYWNGFAGFLSGWNYWMMFILVGMTELTAAGLYIQHWFPNIPTWASAAFFFVLINGVNLVNVRLYGETEFWLSVIKVFAIIAMIIFGCYLLFSGKGGSESTVKNLWQFGVFPNGFGSFLIALSIIMFSFGGLELVGITAAEAENPSVSIPKATNQVVYRILIFYIGSLLVLLSLYPWTKIVGEQSPFVMIFHDLGEKVVSDALNFKRVSDALNFVILIAALSVYNSGVYSNSRMLYGLSKQGNAPKILTAVTKTGVPVNSLAVSAALTSIVVVVNYILEGKAFEILMSLVVTTLVLNWIMISLSHLKFRKAMEKEGRETVFKALFYPYGNYFTLAFLFFILAIILTIEGLRISVILIPFWIGILWVGYFIAEQNRKLQHTSREEINDEL